MKNIEAIRVILGIIEENRGKQRKTENIRGKQRKIENIGVPLRPAQFGSEIFPQNTKKTLGKLPELPTLFHSSRLYLFSSRLYSSSSRLCAT